MSAIQQWLDGLACPIPLQLVPANAPEVEGLAKSLSEALEKSGSTLGGAFEALLYLRIGLMEPAHGNVQDAKRGIEAYIHGVLHRMEGDTWNAKYWFGRVNDPKLIKRIDQHMLTSQIANWSGPEDFADACKSPSVVHREDLSRIASCEWETLWQIVNEKNPR